MINAFARRLHHLAKRVRQRIRVIEAQRLGIISAEPNYLFIDRFTPESIVIDAGCGNYPDFSLLLIERCGLTSFGVDPTRKHQSELARHAEETGGRFVPVPVAVARTSGECIFYESQVNVSGSLQTDHLNVRMDELNQYTVETLNLNDLCQRIGVEEVALLKLDLEGSEYELLSHLNPETMATFDQVFVEFHHHCLLEYSRADTERSVSALKKLGYLSFSFDNHNYLFFRPAKRMD